VPGTRPVFSRRRIFASASQFLHAMFICRTHQQDNGDIIYQVTLSLFWPQNFYAQRMRQRHVPVSEVSSDSGEFLLWPQLFSPDIVVRQTGIHDHLKGSPTQFLLTGT
jgi:hypothetical protein